MGDKIDQSCSFCGKGANEIKKLIAGSQNVCICNECIDLCHGIITNKVKAVVESEDDNSDTIPTPRQIKAHLDQYVIGQEDAKTTIAVAVYNHYRRLENPEVDGVEIDKSNILMFGPTGSGKTLIAQSVARMLDVPLSIADATGITEAGYVGDDVESIVTRLLQAAGGDVKKAERGIIFIDEIDKKRAKASGANGRDVSGEGVQQALLKLLEGTDVMVSPQGRKSELTKLSTRNILFIVGGAFVGLDKIVGEKNKAAVGFNVAPAKEEKATTGNPLTNVQPEHLVKFGLIPELIGRLPVYAPLEELTEDQLVRVLTEPKNAVVKQFHARFALDNVDLVFEEDALREVARIAKERKTGARGLRSVIENSLMQTQFVLPELADDGIGQVVVDLAAVKGEDQPKKIKA